MSKSSKIKHHHLVQYTAINMAIYLQITNTKSVTSMAFQWHFNLAFQCSSFLHSTRIRTKKKKICFSRTGLSKMIHIWKCIYYLIPFVLGKTRDNSPAFLLKTDWFLLCDKNNRASPRLRKQHQRLSTLAGLSVD